MTTQRAARHRVARRLATTLIALATTTGTMLLAITPAGAAIVPTVPLGTAAAYSVVGHSTVTNTGPTVIVGSVGLWSGTSITGFPPGGVVPPGTIDTTNAVARQAQSDITAAYINAAGRSISATTSADLANDHLQAGVYAGPSHGALRLTGPLVLDGAGNANSVFIFQTDSSLTTASSSTVTLVNGAQACNVFWQVGSSATLGTGSVFSGTILALASVTVTTGVTVHGRALARTGAVTLDTDVFTRPTCALSAPGAGTPPTLPGGAPAPTLPGGAPAPTLPGGAPVPTLPGTPPGGPGVPPVGGPPRTGVAPLHNSSQLPLVALFAGLFGTAVLAGTLRSRRVRARALQPNSGR